MNYAMRLVAHFPLVEQACRSPQHHQGRRPHPTSILSDEPGRAPTIRPALAAAILALVLVLVPGCQMVNTTRSGAIGIEREQMMMVSASGVEVLAKASHDEMISMARKSNALNRDVRLLKRLRRIAGLLIPHTRVFRDDAPNWSWQVDLVRSTTLNAMCFPGGRIVFLTGIVERLRLTDDEIAAIMGHEIAHALREHIRERISHAQSAQIVVEVTRIAAGKKGGAAASELANTFFLLPNNRTGEQESDRIGVELAARAGFDPRAAISVWKKMAAATSNTKTTPEFLSTHPSHDSRIADLTEQAEVVLSLFLGARNHKRRAAVRVGGAK